MKSIKPDSIFVSKLGLDDISQGAYSFKPHVASSPLFFFLINWDKFIALSPFHLFSSFYFKLISLLLLVLYWFYLLIDISLSKQRWPIFLCVSMVTASNVSSRKTWDAVLTFRQNPDLRTFSDQLPFQISVDFTILTEWLACTKLKKKLSFSSLIS